MQRVQAAGGAQRQGIGQGHPRPVADPSDERTGIGPIELRRDRRDDPRGQRSVVAAAVSDLVGEGLRHGPPRETCCIACLRHVALSAPPA